MMVTRWRDLKEFIDLQIAWQARVARAGASQLDRDRAVERLAGLQVERQAVAADLDTAERARDLWLWRVVYSGMIVVSLAILAATLR